MIEQATQVILSARLTSHDTVFFSHSKTASAGLSAAKTISRIAPMTEHQSISTYLLQSISDWSQNYISFLLRRAQQISNIWW